jgi:aspartyl-tRNA synthetase
MLRTHTCGELRKQHKGKKVTLCGWVDRIRISGSIGFIMLRDRYGITQIFLNKALAKENTNLRKESIIQVEGTVNERPKKQIKKELLTGEIELEAKEINVLNNVPPLPLELDESIHTTEETRLKYRYLDLKKPRMQKNIIIKHRVIKAMRDFLDKEEFIDIETPMLAKSTPEGARDYLVPSRMFPGKYFALPQSPQLFKQLLMISGFDKYYQFAKCFRDEDLRADRQPEFLQLDLELSFVTEEDVYAVIERMFQYVWKEALGINIKIPFERITYKKAMKKYKSDKPDMRKKGEKYKFVWVTEFPMYEYSEEEKKYVPAHHPFTGVHEDDLKLLKKSPKKVRSTAYDLVLNGVELASGSIRIHDREVQSKVFNSLGMSGKEAKEKFGFFLEALKYAPPHGGIAFGVDRIIQIITNEPSIREVIVFPKNKEAYDPMLESPSKVSKKQLKELKLR